MLLDLDPKGGRMVWVQAMGKFMNDHILSDPRRQQNGLPVKGHPTATTE
jgi:hypothetical protein